MNEIKEVQEILDHTQSDDLLEKEARLLQALDRVLEQEEVLWNQKSSEKWMMAGDRNTSFFHTSTVIRRRRNRIETLRNEEGVWLSDPK